MHDPIRASLRYGWTALAVFITMGLVLEALHVIKWPAYFEVEIRRELWTLAHAHGGLLAIVNLVFAALAARLFADDKAPALAGRMLRWGAMAVPAGFFLGGIGNSESDPSLAIVLVPIGALLVLHAVVTAAIASFRGPRSY